MSRRPGKVAPATGSSVVPGSGSNRFELTGEASSSTSSGVQAHGLKSGNDLFKAGLPSYFVAKLRNSATMKRHTDFIAANKPFFWLTRSVLTLQVALSIVLLAIPREHSTESIVSSDDSTITAATIVFVQDSSAIIALLASVAAALVVFRPFPNAGTTRWTGLSLLHLFGLMLDLTNLAYPTRTRLAVTYSSMVLRVVAIILCTILNYRWDKHFPTHSLAPHKSVVPKLGTKERLRLLDDVEQVLEIHNSRRNLYKILYSGSRRFSVFAIIILLLSIGNFISEFRKTISTHGEFFEATILDDMNNWTNVEKYFGTNRTSARKALIVVVDGLSAYGASQKDFLSLVESDLFARDSRKYNMSVQLPTMSVPNWLTTVTGVKPEITGVWGNLGIPETNFDNIYRLAEHYKLNRGITCSPWFSGLVTSRLPLLNGDGTVPFEYALTDTAPSADSADRMRSEVTRVALSQSVPANQYSLFLTHWSDVDLQGHVSGTKPPYNMEDTYLRAVANRTVELKQFIDLLDNDTLLVLTADHGMLERGGHGGASIEVLTVPTWFYVKNSGMRDKAYTGPRFREALQNVDLAPTVSAFMGMPVPRQSQGVVANDIFALFNSSQLLLHHRDMMRQKQGFLKAYLRATLSEANATESELINRDLSSTDLAAYRDTIQKLEAAYEYRRAGVIENELVRNVLATIGINVLIVFALLFVVQRYTFCDLVSITKAGSPASDEPGQYHNRTSKRNKICFASALVAMGVHLGLTVAVFLILFWAYGYAIWDSTYLHFPTSVVIYFCYVLIPSILLSVIALRSYSIPFLKPFRPTVTSWDRFLVYIRVILGIQEVRYERLEYVFLFKYYCLLISVFNILLLFVVQASYTFIVPEVFRIDYVLQQTWGFRFRVITVQLMLFPVTIINLVSLNSWGAGLDPVDDVFDSVYRLYIDKLHAHGQLDTDAASELKRHFSGGRHSHRATVRQPILLFCEANEQALDQRAVWDMLMLESETTEFDDEKEGNEEEEEEEQDDVRVHENTGMGVQPVTQAEPSAPSAT